MSRDEFSKKFQTLQQAIATLQQCIGGEALQSGEDLAEIMEALQTSLEELQVADEELRQQQEGLAVERQTAETERQRYEDLFEFAPDGYLVTDAQGMIYEANRVAATLLAVPRERLIDKPLVAFVPLPERHAFRTHLAHLEAGKQLQVWDGMLQPGEGTPFFAALTVAPMRDQKGILVGWRWLIRDISERKRTQEALRAERDFITALLDTVGALVVVLDLHGRIVRFNRAAEQTTGYTFDDIRGKHIWDLFLAPEDVEPFQAIFQTLTADQPQFPHTSTWVMRDGRRQQITWSYAVLHDAWGRVAYVVGAGLDITALLRAQQESQASAARVQAILDTAIDGILSLDEEGRIEACNPAAERLFGYNADEMIGQPLAMCISSPAHDAHMGDIMHAIRTGEKQFFGSEGEVIGKHRDGTTFPIELAVGDMHLNGRRLFTGIVRDLTERRQMEEKMRHTDRLALVGQLASGLAHEIGTPLNIIAGNAELLLMELPAIGAHRGELETIVAQSDRISRLIEQLLTFARKEPHHVMIPLSIEQPLSQALRLLQTRFGQAEITTLVDIPANLPLVHGVEDQLEQVFLNVLVNAWQAMPEGGRVTVQAGTTPDRHVTISFCDTGCGISENEIARIFEPFYTTKKERGTGLGLTICQQIIQAHHGAISIHSTLHKGTTVTITLPAIDIEAS